MIGELIVGLVVLAVVAAAAQVVGGDAKAVDDAALVRQLRAKPRRCVREMADGKLGVVVGVVRPLPRAGLTRAPLSRRDCVAFRASLELGERIVGEQFAAQVAAEQDARDFELCDETGSLVVEVAGAHFILAAERVTAASDLAGHMLARATGHRSLAGLSPMEAVIMPGARVAVMGRATSGCPAGPVGRATAAAGPFRDSGATRSLTIRTSREALLVVTDREIGG